MVPQVLKAHIRIQIDLILIEISTEATLKRESLL